MKRVKWYLVLLLVSTLLLAGGCGVTEEPPVIPPVPETPTEYSDILSIPIGEFQNRPHIDVDMQAMVGGELTVTLGSNPTTGYQWLEEAKISDETIVQQVSHKFVGPGIDKPPGTPGEEVWIFKALRKGTVTILLEYCRWNGAGLWAVFINANIK
jgi:inhibitor of cysteine peptidase